MRVLAVWSVLLGVCLVAMDATAATASVTIDVRPRAINAKSHGTIRVAIFPGTGVTIEDIDVTSLTFGADGNEQSLAFCESRHTGRGQQSILLCHFNVADSGLRPGHTQAVLRGALNNGVRFRADDAVHVIAPGRRNPPPPLEINPDQARLAPVSVSKGSPLQTLSSVSFANSVNHEVQQLEGPAGDGGGPALAVFIDVAAAPGPNGPPNPQICNVQSIAALTPQDLVQWLKVQDADCLNYFLWSYSPSLGATYSNANMTAVLAEIQNAAGQYVGTNAQNLRELMMFVRIGYYHQATGQVPSRRSRSTR